jgi:hypothetical protein
VATSGAQPGNNNEVKGKRWYAAIDRALAKRSRVSGIAALDELADNLLELCAQKDLGALRELGDRLDGKSPQAITGDGGGPLIVQILKFSESDKTDAG